MREIKFRIFSEGKMRYPHPKETVFSNAIFYRVNMADQCIEPEMVAKMKLMQFTGVKDFYGRDIYEGDILQTETGYAIVVWEDMAFALKSPGSDAVDWEHSSKYSQYVIDSNIYENPQLLSSLKTDA